MEESRTIVLIHGQWLTPRSWRLFRGYYEARGYRVLAPAWPCMKGEVEEIRRKPWPLDGLGIAQIVDHYQKIVRSLDEPPILMGHALGGLVTQILLDRGFGSAGVAIASVAPRGIYRLPVSVLKTGRPVLANPLNYWRSVRLTLPEFRYAVANTAKEGEVREAFEQLAIPGPGRVPFQLAFANLNPWSPARVNFRNGSRAPLLLIAGSEDHLSPAVVNRIAYKKYQGSLAVTAYKEFPGRCHFLIGQEGWQEVAEYALSWAQEHTGTGRVHSVGA